MSVLFIYKHNDRNMNRTKVILAALLGVGILSSCGSSTKQQETVEDKGALEQVSESVGALKNLSKLEEYSKELESQINTLKAQTPVSNDVLKSVLPETFEGLKRTSLKVGEMSALNFASAKAEYKNEDGSKRIDVDVMDGAGEGASSIVSLVFMGLHADKEEVMETGFEKTMDIDGMRVAVKENTDEGIKDSEIKWVYNKRFVIELEGDGYSLDELIAIFKKMDLSSLK